MLAGPTGSRSDPPTTLEVPEPEMRAVQSGHLTGTGPFGGRRRRAEGAGLFGRGFPSYFKSARKGGEAGRGRTVSRCRGMSLCSWRRIFLYFPRALLLFDHVLAEVVVCAVGWVVTLPAMEMTAQATALLVLVPSLQPRKGGKKPQLTVMFYGFIR